MVIRYGYKLFAAGVFKADTSRANTEMSGRVGEYELKFKTAAPGAVLFLFGAIIIVLAIASAPPELTRQKKIMHERVGAGRTTAETTERMRGEDIALGQLLEEAAKYKGKGQNAEAIRSYQQAIRSMARPMNELARLYKESNQFEHAKALAEVAVMLNPSDPDFTITLEEIRRSMEKK